MREPIPREAGGREMALDILIAKFAPLLAMDEAAYILGDCGRMTIQDHIDEGRLRAVDISRAGEDGERRDLRVYRYSLVHLLTRAGSALTFPPPEVIFPHDRPMLRRDEVSALLNCSPEHVGRLPLEGPTHGAHLTPGSANRTPRVWRRSLITFLVAREVHP